MTIRHFDFRQTVLVHDISFFDDAIPVQNNSAQSVDIIRGKSPLATGSGVLLQGPWRHGAVDEVPERRRKRHIAPYGYYWGGAGECALASHQTRVRVYAPLSLLSMANSTLSGE